MPGPMSQSDGKLLRKLPGAYWSQRLRMGWSSKGEIVRVTMPSITPSLGFFFHLRTRAVAQVGVDARRRRGVDSHTFEASKIEGPSTKLTLLVTRSRDEAGRQVLNLRVA